MQWRWAAISTAVVVLGACSSDTSSSEVTATTCVPPVDQTDVAYVPTGDPLQRLDLYVPSDGGCGPRPVVVWVHGGGWQIGDKRNGMDAKVSLWTDAGWAVASVNYRLTDPDAPEDERVVAPAHDEDVAAAVGWLVDHAEDAGIDPDRIALLGHSSGAAIVAALATDPTYLGAVDLTPTDLACVGPLDTEGFDVEAAALTGPSLSRVYEPAFGTDPARWSELSPLTHVGDAALPDLFLVTRGTPERRELVATFTEAVERAGGDVTVVDLPSFSHEDVNKRIGVASDRQLTPALQDFLADCLG